MRGRRLPSQGSVRAPRPFRHFFRGRRRGGSSRACLQVGGDFLPAKKSALCRQVFCVAFCKGDYVGGRLALCYVLGQLRSGAGWAVRVAIPDRIEVHEVFVSACAARRSLLPRPSASFRCSETNPNRFGFQDKSERKIRSLTKHWSQCVYVLIFRKELGGRALSSHGSAWLFTYAEKLMP